MNRLRSRTDRSLARLVGLALLATSLLATASARSQGRDDPAVARLGDTITHSDWRFLKKGYPYGLTEGPVASFPCLDGRIRFGRDRLAELECGDGRSQSATWKLARSRIGGTTVDLTESATGTAVSFFARMLRGESGPVLELLETTGGRPDEGKWYEYIEQRPEAK